MGARLLFARVDDELSGNNRQQQIQGSFTSFRMRTIS
jgi:hypothetical protein